MKQKIQMELNEMGNADVHFISLVDRGANRIPFRILKAEEDQMINLTTLFTKKKEVEPVHEVSGIAVSKGSDHAAMTTVLKEQGFNVHQIIEQADNDLFVVKADADWSIEHQVLKMSDDIVVLVQTQKGFCSYPESNSFAENIKASGFYSGMSSACNTLGDTVYNILCSASTPPVEDVRKACTEFTEYMVGLVSALPVTTFKLERIAKVEAVAKADTVKCPECGAEDQTPGSKCSECGADIPVAAKKEEGEEITPTPEVGENTLPEPIVETLETPAGEVETITPTPEPLPGEVAAETPAASLDIAAMIETGLAKISEGLQTMFDTQFTSQISSAVAKLDTVATEVQNLSQRIEKTEESLNGTVLGAASQDTTPNTITQKSERVDAGCFDTAFKFPGLED